MDELLEQFLIEGRDLVTEAQAALVILRDDPANARAIDGAFRAVHTLKGSVAIFDMAPAERLLHAAEEGLAEARRVARALSPGEIASLIATLDQVDRWIDQMETTGALPADAAGVVATLLAPPDDADAIDDGGWETPPPPADLPAWVGRLIAREQAAITQHDRPLVAFCYAPDADAFFRGDDPVALAAAVPALVALAILPVGGAWPALDAIDPFSCSMIIEGLSTAALPELQAAFRLVPDQIAFHAVDPGIAVVAGEALPQAAAFLRVDTARVDALADGVGELVVATNALSPIADRADPIDQDLALALRAAQANLRRAVGAIQRSVQAVRLVPLAPSLRRLPRIVREAADDVGKQIIFEMRGDQAETDKQIADGLFEPLLHLVRNAIDHGIEPPADRAAAGKPTAGRLTLAISRDGDDVVVTLADDGAGIDPARIRAIAVARGVIDRDTAAALSDQAAVGLIFTPGFSTASQVSGVSGRGVGMDAVQTAVDRMRGRIGIDSRIGQGTSFILRLPANALTTRLLVIGVGDDRYAVPFDQIAETVRVDDARLVPLGAGLACVLRDRTVPVLSLAALLGGAGGATLPAHLLVTHAGGEPVALRVDRFGEQIDAVVRRPSGLLAGVPSLAGTTVLGDGGVMLVLNLPELIA